MGLLAPDSASCCVWVSVDPQGLLVSEGHLRVSKLVSWSPSCAPLCMRVPHVLVSEWVLYDHACGSTWEHRVPASLFMYCQAQANRNGSVYKPAGTPSSENVHRLGGM